MKLIVLDEATLAIVAERELSTREAQDIRDAILTRLPGWRALIFQGPGDVVDFRNLPGEAQLSRELLDRLQAVYA